jgi:hypothetical protein
MRLVGYSLDPEDSYQDLRVGHFDNSFAFVLKQISTTDLDFPAK